MQSVELVVVGAGPAGLGAAIEAARRGVKVTVFDENRRPGGQLVKQLHKFFGSADHLAGRRGFDIGKLLLRQAEEAGADVRLATAVWGLFSDNVVAVKGPKSIDRVKAEKIVLATGAMENPLAFPGWTLPGVMGAGAAQTLMNEHRVLPGRSALMVGSGNVGLIVTYQLLQAGAKVAAIIEAAPRIGGYGVHAAKVRRAGVPILLSHTIARATGEGRVQRAEVVGLDRNWQPVPGTERAFEVDLICLSVGLSPLAELARMAGCAFTFVPELGGYVPVHDADLETSVPGVYVAGDITGVEEASTALDEGRLAGVAVAEALGRISSEEAAREKETIRARLAVLRSGSFGEKRRKGKASILARSADPAKRAADQGKGALA